MTVRTAHSRYLLRPSSELNKIFAGCLGRALELYPARLHAVIVMSSHAHLLASPEDSKQLADWQARDRGEKVEPSQFGTDYQIHLEPLPCWEHLDDSVWRGFVREIVEGIEKEAMREHQRNETAPTGATAVLQKPPHYLPGRQNKSPAPRFHAATKEAWEALVDGLREFVAAYREAAEKVAIGLVTVPFPDDCFPSRLRHAARRRVFG